jgi:hypothetical protein
VSTRLEAHGLSMLLLVQKNHQRVRNRRVSPPIHDAHVPLHSVLAQAAMRPVPTRAQSLALTPSHHRFRFCTPSQAKVISIANHPVVNVTASTAGHSLHLRNLTWQEHDDREAALSSALLVRAANAPPPMQAGWFHRRAS